MNTAALSLFVDVMRHGSFAAVARSRNVDPSSISRAIAGLEDELGVRLFNRTTRKLSPTEAGSLYFAHIEPLVGELAAARDTVREIGTNPTGTLRVTASTTCGQRLIVPLLKDFRAAYPLLSLELLLIDQNLDLIAERIDLALRFGPRMDSGYVGTKLMDIRYYAVASPDYIAQAGRLDSPQDLSGRACLSFDLPDYRSRWVFCDEAGVAAEVPITAPVVISSAEALRRCALDGMGPALLPDWIVDEDLKRGALVDLFPRHRVTATDYETGLWALYPSRSYLPLKVRLFLDFLKARIGSVGKT